jgi:quercetin dioxygenase-like cupin family protein
MQHAATKRRAPEEIPGFTSTVTFRRITVSGEGIPVDKSSLTAWARTRLDAARSASSGRASRTVYGGHEHALRQTVIALSAGQELNEHENPGEATLQVLQGRVELRAGDVATAHRKDLLIVPEARHSLAAVDDSVVLLTVAKVSD